MLQENILDYLEEKKEPRAVKWFQEYMTGPGEGQWMHAHSTIGSAPNNMGNESYFRWTKLATNSKKQVSLNHFLGGFISYAANVNHEEFSKISDMLPIQAADQAARQQEGGSGSAPARSEEGRQPTATVTVSMSPERSQRGESLRRRHCNTGCSVISTVLRR